VDIERLTKLMRMTESAHDGEALNALRLANKILRDANLHWGDVLTPKRNDNSHLVPPSKRPGFNKKPNGAAYGRRAERSRYDGGKGRHEDPEIEDWFDRLDQRQHSLDFRMFLSSVRGFWERHGYLTDNQYDAVKRAVERGP
jgi:hypothetical protein